MSSSSNPLPTFQPLSNPIPNPSQPYNQPPNQPQAPAHRTPFPSLFNPHQSLPTSNSPHSPPLPTTLPHHQLPYNTTNHPATPPTTLPHHQPPYHTTNHPHHHSAEQGPGVDGLLPSDEQTRRFCVAADVRNHHLQRQEH